MGLVMNCRNKGTYTLFYHSTITSTVCSHIQQVRIQNARNDCLFAAFLNPCLRLRLFGPPLALYEQQLQFDQATAWKTYNCSACPSVCGVHSLVYSPIHAGNDDLQTCSGSVLLAAGAVYSYDSQVFVSGNTELDYNHASISGGDKTHAISCNVQVSQLLCR